MTSTEVGIVTVAVLGALLIGWTAASIERNRTWQREAIGRGLATYCPFDGEWAWKGECVE